MKYLYETHLHTCQGSACGISKGCEYPKLYQDLGYDGLFVTDHFFQGNCAAPRTGVWKDRVDAYMAGYLDALNTGEKIGFKVFFGIEQNYSGDEYLLYGIDRDFLLDNPDIEHVSRDTLFERVHAYGGCVVQAHPFRERGYISKMHFQLDGIDAVEAVNMGNHPHEDASALKYAARLGLPVTGGSDIHNSLKVTPDRICATAFGEKINSAKEYAARIRQGKDISLVYPAERLQGVLPQMPLTPFEAGRDGKIIEDFDLEQYIKQEEYEL